MAVEQRAERNSKPYSPYSHVKEHEQKAVKSTQR